MSEWQEIVQQASNLLDDSSSELEALVKLMVERDPAERISLGSLVNYTIVSACVKRRAEAEIISQYLISQSKVTTEAGHLAASGRHWIMRQASN